MVVLPGSNGAPYVKASGKSKAPYRYEVLKVIGRATVIIKENEFKIHQTR